MRRGSGPRSTPPQPEILRYAQHVADKHDLRRDIQFSHAGRSARVGRERRPVAGAHRPRRHASPAASTSWRPDACRCPRRLDIAGTERFQGDVLLHQPLAARRRRLHRQARRRDRHRLVGDPVDPDHGRAGGAAHRLPAHAELLDAGQQRPDPRGASWTRSPRDRAAYREAARWSGGGRAARGQPRSSALAVSDEERLAKYEEVWGYGGIIQVLGSYTDHLVNAGRQRARCASSSATRSAPIVERSRRRPRRCARRLPDRHQAAVPRHRLLRDLQPAPRPARRPPQAPDRDRSPRRASTSSTSRSSSTPSSSPPASTR